MPTIDLRRRLADLDTQIAEHRRVISQLEEARTAIERELYAASFPVLTALPAEIIAEIFVHCLPPFANLGWYRSIHQYENIAPIVLTSVCRTWRDIALTTPTLWSVLDIPFDIISPRLAFKTASGEDLIDRWLARAGEHALSFVFRAVAGWGEDDVGPLPPRMHDLIHCYSHRVRYLELYTTERQMRHLGLDSVEFPLLQSASLNCQVLAFDFDSHSQPVEAFKKAPRFHELHRLPRPRLKGRTSLSSNLRITLPWLQLVKYDGPIYNTVLFKEALNLTDVTCYLEYIEDDNTFEKVTHSTLKSLTLRSSCAGLLQCLTLPALQHLDVSADSSVPSLELLARSSPPLVSLCIQANDHHFEAWRHGIRRVHSTLETLQLHRPSTQAMSALFPSHSESILSLSSLPNLRSVHLQDVSCDHGRHYHSLVKYLYSASHLRSFRLVWTVSPFLDSTLYSGPPKVIESFDTIEGHLARIARAGTEIYFGTEDKNYVAKKQKSSC
ncbi:hypothetical protein K438DRAFT_1803003 [Mycena galopus ATCC 62051]|nr:hypothetical protein K438DRAFT_1803003 [Mycena galopus ATCC 62051]